MANLRVGTGITFDGGTGNISVCGIITASGGGASSSGRTASSLGEGGSLGTS